MNVLKFKAPKFPIYYASGPKVYHIKEKKIKNIWRKKKEHVRIIELNIDPEYKLSRIDFDH